MEKAIYPRNDRKNGVISRLLPQVKDDTNSIDDFDLLRISSVVDGTEVKGHGVVNGHSYGWKMAIESAVKSIAVVPDRFFDVTGRSYSIDQYRKVSVDSLPDYENYKDAIIYRINTNNKTMFPPIATIIFDNEMQNRRGIEKTVTIKIREEEQEASTISKVFAKKGWLWEGNCICGDINENDGTFEPTIQAPNTLDGSETKFVGADQTYVILNPDQKVSFEKVEIPGELEDDEPTITYEAEITFRTFVLNNYGIEKFLGKTKVSLISEDVEGSLVGYLQNHATTLMFDWAWKQADFPDSSQEDRIVDEYKSISSIDATLPIKDADYLAIIVDNNNNYYALVGQIEPFDGDGEGLSENDKEAQSDVLWYKPKTAVELSQFKGIDMWLRFNSINEMIYFLLTKYQEDIMSIKPVVINPKAETSEGNWDVNRNATVTTERTSLEDNKMEGRLWAYVNPRTMKPYEDDYWFHSGEPFYIKSLTIAPEGKKLKAQQIVVRADEWPGMYMVIGETMIRNRDTHEDERMQIKFPSVKVKADQTLTLSADGDPTTFTLSLEVAKPRNGHMMELTAYEIAPKMIQGENGCFYAADGSSEVVIE